MKSTHKDAVRKHVESRCPILKARGASTKVMEQTAATALAIDEPKKVTIEELIRRFTVSEPYKSPFEAVSDGIDPALRYLA